MTEFTIVPLGDLDRTYFHSGIEALDNYFVRQVGQDIRRRIASCHVAVENTSTRIAGFYTLSAATLALEEIPEFLAKRLPRYPVIPAARIGRLAVDQSFRGCKLGTVLLADATLRAGQSDVKVFALVVEAKDRSAEEFYEHHGFVSCGSAPGRMMAGIDLLLGRG